MAGIDDLFKNGLGTGLAVAVGVAVLGPIVMPALARGLKPVVKGAIKGGIVAYGWGREAWPRCANTWRTPTPRRKPKWSTAKQ